MRFLSLLPEPIAETPSDFARQFISELLRWHVNSGAYASHIQSTQDGQELLGQIRIREGGRLKEVVREKAYPRFFSQVMAAVVKSAGLMPDSSSISQYDLTREIRFYAKNEFLVAQFVCTASMPKTKMPQAHFKMLDAKEFEVVRYSNI